MSLVLIFGPQAVGKMTVGQQLEKITDLKLFHNHMTIDLVHPFFSYGTEKGKAIVKDFRHRILSEIAESSQPGIIFTMVWELDRESDWKYVEYLRDIFIKNNRQVYLVELETDLDTRLERNKSEHRLQHKPFKRDVEWSESMLLENEKSARLNSKKGEIKFENHLKINNTTLSPQEVAKKIVDTFTL